MAQSLYKSFSVKNKDKEKKAYEELMKEVEKMEQFQKLLEEPPPNFNDFYDGLSRIVEKLSIKRGGSHISLPDKHVIKKAFEECGEGKPSLTKEEFREFIKKMLVRGIGLRNTQMAMYLAGVPAVSLIIKPFMPGSISQIPNGFLIPAVTSVTAFFLARMRKI